MLKNKLIAVVLALGFLSVGANAREALFVSVMLNSETLAQDFEGYAINPNIPTIYYATGKWDKKSVWGSTVVAHDVNDVLLTFLMTPLVKDNALGVDVHDLDGANGEKFILSLWLNSTTHAASQDTLDYALERNIDLMYAIQDMAVKVLKTHEISSIRGAQKSAAERTEAGTYYRNLDLLTYKTFIVDTNNSKDAVRLIKTIEMNLKEAFRSQDNGPLDIKTVIQKLNPRAMSCARSL